MAIKKTQLYSKLWASCNQLRGGMDASQYKDYILVLLFIKYISDKYADEPYAPITVPKGSSFKDMVALKGSANIGDDINKKIIAPIAEANNLSEMPDFNNAEKLGSGKDMVNKLTNLIAIFEDPALDFSKNRAEGDDILGDAYEYLMKNFATESGKSKGQFYTPAEVSRVIAKTIGIANTNITYPTVYDPTCGSGSLLLKVADETEKNTKLCGQEMDNANAALARMNMILHNNPTSEIKRENTLSEPLFKNGEQLKTFDFVVANPPFSYSSWSNGFNPVNDKYERFQDLGVPPPKNGDYAFLLHIIKSMKTTGKGACILPHGVLFRGNAESVIRTNIIRRGYIKGIIGLPANLFYGTGIPACIIILDKENAHQRKGIFIIDASKGFVKDGSKNRLRTQDIHKIVDVFNKQLEIPKYSRMVSVDEIEKNEFNLNIPRYIDSQEPEDIQSIEAHLLGGIPTVDIDELEKYWSVYPTLKATLFGASDREGFSRLKISPQEIKHSIFSHPEFTQYARTIEATFANWKENNTIILKSLTIGAKPKEIIHCVSEAILETFSKSYLIDPYDIYQHLMEYWAETMQDDMYMIAVDGWKAEPYRILVTVKVKGKEDKQVDKGWGCDLVPKTLVIDRYFLAGKKAIEKMEAERDIVATTLQEREEEQSGDEGYFFDYDNVNKANVQNRLKAIDNGKFKIENSDEINVLKTYLKLIEDQAELNKKIKEETAKLDIKVLERYKTITEDEIKQLVVDDKWMANIERSVKTEMERISQRLTQRIKELAERYETPLPKQTTDVAELEAKVTAHLKKMGFNYK